MIFFASQFLFKKKIICVLARVKGGRGRKKFLCHSKKKQKKKKNSALYSEKKQLPNNNMIFFILTGWFSIFG